MSEITLPNGFEIRHVILDGEQRKQLKCPECEEWGFIDEDQWTGTVSIDCPRCDFHETHNLRAMYAKSRPN